MARLQYEHERDQKKLFDDFVSAFEEHYNDDFTRAYKNNFIYPWLMGDLPLKGGSALDAMCGNGQVVEYLLGRGARVSGLDISKVAMDSFRHRWPGARAVEGSILSPDLEYGSFDLVVIIGGLHHLHPHVHQAVGVIHKLLKPRGWFCFMEPHSGSVWDLPRKIWYRLDRSLFASNEASIDLLQLESEHAADFKVVKRAFAGSLGYLLVLNSMIFRLPMGLKKSIAKPLMRLEAVLQPRLGRRSACFSLSVWQKK